MFPMFLFKDNKKDEVVEFICEAENTETKEKMCVYKTFPKCCADVIRYKCKPKEVFFSNVWKNNDFVQRFIPVSNIYDIFTKEELKELQGIIKGTIPCTDMIKNDNANTFRYYVMGC